LVSPTLLFLVGLISFPVLYNVYLGFFRVNALQPGQCPGEARSNTS
jgi:ABC-type sugar transport system permease subunit